MKCHIINGTIHPHNITAVAENLSALCEQLPDLNRSYPNWRNDPVYLIACIEGDVRPVYALSNATFAFNPPSEYMNFDNRTEAELYLRSRRTGSTSAVTCLTTGQTFPSVAAACRELDIAQPLVVRSVREGRAVFSKTLQAYTWVMNDKTPTLQPPTDNRTTAVLCVTTGEQYDTMSDAAVDHGVHLSAISRAIRTGKTMRSNKTCSSVEFRKT